MVELCTLPVGTVFMGNDDCLKIVMGQGATREGRICCLGLTYDCPGEIFEVMARTLVREIGSSTEVFKGIK